MNERLDMRLEMYRDDLKRVSDSASGKRILARLFAEANCLSSVHRSGAEVYRLSGIQAFALALWRDLHAANPEASLAIFNDLMTPLEPIEEMEDD